MSFLINRIAIQGLQIPADGMTAAEARALAVPNFDSQPATSTDEASSNGETTPTAPAVIETLTQEP